MVKELFKNIKALVGLVFLAGLLFAILSQFNYDILEFFTWCIDKIVELIIRIKDYFVSLPVFRNLFKG